MGGVYYESEQLLNEYLLFHYGDAEDQLPWQFGPASALGFPVRCVGQTLDRSALSPEARALDVGCAVGRSAFELSAFCREVVGVDFSQSFIQTARELAQNGSHSYRIKETGSIDRPAVARVPDNARPERVRFEVGDAQNLSPELADFDVVLACNLLCRLPQPELFLRRLPDLVAGGGQLVLTTPHTWLEEFTAREFWLGATPATGEPLEAIRKILEPAFELSHRLNLPFLIREHRRKFQWSVAEATVWRRT